MESITGRPIPTHQRLLLKQELQGNNFLALAQAGKFGHRREFKSQRNSLIKEWERQTKQTWPVYTQEVFSKAGKPLDKIGKLYDAHEIIPNQYGAPFTWYNIHPAKGGVQHQGGIHGTNSALNKIEKQISWKKDQ